MKKHHSIKFERLFLMATKLLFAAAGLVVGLNSVNAETAPLPGDVASSGKTERGVYMRRVQTSEQGKMIGRTAKMAAELICKNKGIPFYWSGDIDLNTQAVSHLYRVPGAKASHIFSDYIDVKQQCNQMMRQHRDYLIKKYKDGVEQNFEWSSEEKKFQTSSYPLPPDRSELFLTPTEFNNLLDKNKKNSFHIQVGEVDCLGYRCKVMRHNAPKPLSEFWVIDDVKAPAMIQGLNVMSRNFDGDGKIYLQTQVVEIKNDVQIDMAVFDVPVTQAPSKLSAKKQ